MLRLLVENKYELDIANVSVGIFKEILDMDNISRRSSSWTREIELPNTPNNNRFFETIYKLDKSTFEFKKGKRLKAVITNGSDTLLDGFMQLINTKVSEGNTVYNIVFAGQLIDLMKSIEDLTLNVLPLDEYNHTRNWPTIRNSWDFNIYKNETLINSREGYVYPDIIYKDNGLDGDKYVFDYMPATNIKTIFDKIFDVAGFAYNSNFLNSAYFKSLYMPFAKDKLNQSDEQIQANKVIRSFNPTTHPQPTDTDYVAMTTAQSPNTPSAGGYWNNQLSSPYGLNWLNLAVLNDKTGVIQPNSNQIQLTDELNQVVNDVYTCQNQGEYKIDINIPMFAKYDLGTFPVNPPLSFQFVDGQLEYRWIVQLVRATGQVEILARNTQPNQSNNPLGLSFFSPSDNVVRNSVPWYDMDTRLDITCNTNRFLNSGDKVRIQLHFKHTNTNWNVSDSTGAISDDAVKAQLMTRRNIGAEFLKYEITPTNNEGYGDEDIVLQDTLPPISCKDFLMSIIQMFNLVVDEDKNSTPEEPIFKIEPYDDFFITNKIVTDWKLDTNSELKQEYNMGIKSYKLSYVQDDDFYNNHYFNNLKPNKIYGEFELFTGDELAQERKELKLIFAPTINANVKVKDRIVPYLCDIQDTLFVQKQTKPRILFYNGRIECNSYLVRPNPTDNALAQEYSYPYIGMWDNPFDPNETLEFGYSQNTYYGNILNTLPKWTLFNKYHQSLRNKINEDYRIVTGYFYITPKQFAEFEFTDLIQIENQLYRVLLIDNYTYDEEERLTKVVLEKIIQNSFYEPNNKINGSSCPTDLRLIRQNGKLVFSSNTGTITEQCCLERGGTWDELTNSCTISLAVGPVPNVEPVGPIGPFKPLPGIYTDVITRTKNIVPIEEPYIIDAGLNVVFPLTKTDNGFIIDGTINNVKNVGTDNSSIINDGNDNEIF
jgi:hypothetical protein